MTLLILPLVESVSEAASEHLTTPEFFDRHAGQMMSFLLSFVLIANFWLGHHRQYDEVTRITRPLLWFNVAWMATIVWLPVPTAMVGQMETDPLQQAVYIGTLVLTQVTTLAARVYLLRHPTLTTASTDRIRHGVAADVAAIVLFSVALAIGVIVGPSGYFALLLLIFTGPIAQLLYRLWPDRRAKDAETPESSEDERPEGSGEPE
ncbi:MAG: DUF1211 domain-containing protein [Microbacterium sp.]|nr:DUF1211 domain-containing protein [Microbacterium sp.]